MVPTMVSDISSDSMIRGESIIDLVKLRSLENFKDKISSSEDEIDFEFIGKRDRSYSLSVN